MHGKLFVLAACAVAALSLAVVASAAAPPTLTGETLLQGGATTSDTCTGAGGPANFDYTGPATGPYTGTYTAHATVTYGVAVGGVSPATGTETFTITTADTTVTGTKQISGGVDCFDGNFSMKISGTYTATIVGPSGSFHDEGTWGGFAVSTTGTNESFTSNLPEPTPLGPTTKSDCKNNGWQSFGIFKNQGDCVSFVATGGRNAAG